MANWKRDLEHGQLHQFRGWLQVRRTVPTKEGGVYTIWDQDGSFIYVGMATKNRGLRGRLAEHANGNRAGDRFNVYIADRLVLPLLEPSQLADISAGTLSFDGQVKAYVRDHLAFRVHMTATDEEARKIEAVIKAGRWPGGSPSLNPT